MQAGRLRHRLAIEQRVAGSPQKTAEGAPDESWSTLATVWGSIEPLRGREFLEAQAVQSRVEVRMRIRHRADVSAGMRVLHDGTYYYIESVIEPDKRGVELQLMCSQGVANG